MSLAWRVSLVYAAVFALVGGYLPFLPRWFAERGLSAGEIGVVLAATTLVRVAVGPLTAYRIDRKGQRRRALVVIGLLATAIVSLMALADGLWMIFLATLAFASIMTPVIPLAETIGVAASRDGGPDYARMRVWGSISFMVSGVIVGAAIEAVSPEFLLAWFAATSLAIAGAANALPPLPALDKAGALRFADVRAVLGNTRVLLVFLGFALAQGSHAAYYGFSAVHWTSIGYGESAVGALWGIAVGAEIVLFSVIDRLWRRGSFLSLAILGGAAGAARWGITVFDPPLFLLVGVQVLHAFSFGAVHLATIRFMSTEIPPDIAATAQSFYANGLGAVVMAIALWSSGRLYAAVGANVFLAMAVMAALGAVLVAIAARTTMPARR